MTLLENIVSGVKKAVTGAVIAGSLYLATPAHGQVTLFIDDNSTSAPAPLTGVAVDSTGKVTASSTGVNYNFNTNLTTGSPASYTNSGGAVSGGIVDLGVTANDLSTIQLYNNGVFNIVSKSTNLGIGGGSITDVASSTWGATNSFTVGANEYTYLGYVDNTTSDNKVGLYNITSNSLVSSFSFTSGASATGLGNYLGLGATGTSTLDQRLLITLSNGSILDFGGDGSLGQSYITSGATNTFFSDVSYFNGQLFLVGSTGSLELANGFTQLQGISAVPEPSTYATLAGGLALMAAIAARRRKFAKAQKEALDTEIGTDGAYQVTEKKPVID